MRLAQGLPEPGSIYELRYEATNPRVLGIGFAATRDLVSHLRHSAEGRDLLGRQPTHALAFGISQAGRYLRDHLAQGFNLDENGVRVFDGVYTHVAGIGRVFFNTSSASRDARAPGTRTTSFPEIEYPFATAAGDAKMIETNTSTEYWQKGASLLHTDGGHDVALPSNVRGYFIAGTQHGGKAGMPRDRGPCINPRNWHDPMAAVRALLVALDEWVANGREPPPSRLPRIDGGTLVRAEEVAWPKLPGLEPPRAANDVAALDDWTDPKAPPQTWQALVPQVDADGNEAAGIRLPDIAVPTGMFTGWNLYKAPMPEGELADRDGTYLAFATERYPSKDAYVARVREMVRALLADRLLLEEDAAAYLERAQG